jgi:cell division protease FtsH
MARNLVLWIVIALVLMLVFQNFTPRHGASRALDYSDFVAEVKSGRVAKVTLDGQTIEMEMHDGSRLFTYSPETDNGPLIGMLLENSVRIEAQAPDRQGLLMQIFISWFPFLLLIAVWIYLMRQMQGGAGGRGALSFGKSRARLLGEDQVRVTFNDVAGVDEAKEEVKELVDFLKDPGKFQKLGGKIPRGVLMVGPPGTGKTLLAKAIAGEAKVPFFTISGSDFVEMFVGVGASRVRDMFEQAKKHAPCIIFIDEIDAVGRHRGAGLGGGHDEREQTLNQLLVEMDGFDGNEGVIVIAATNRPDVLDPALLRPGRFDRQVVVPLPDIRGREQILKVHMRKVPAAEDVKPAILARGTPGFSGADLANLVNEAALFAARVNKRLVDMEEFEKAKDKIMMGAERRSMVMSEKEKKLTAYHEAGHAIVGRLVPEHDPVYKVTIIPRGRALGVTMFLPEEDRLSYSKERLESQISSLFGGRIERHRARDGHRAEHGHALGPVQTPRPDDLQRRRGRGVSRSFRHPAQDGLGRDRAPHRRRGARHRRSQLRARQAHPRGQCRQAAPDGGSPHEVRDARYRADRRHHERAAAATAARLGRRRWPRAA